MTDALAEQHSTAMAEHLYPRSVAIVIHDASDTPIEVGSGTCVRIGSRHLVATAAHVLDQVTTLRDVGVMALGLVGNVFNQTPKLVGSGRRGGKRDDQVDLAWLEIEPKAIPSWTTTWKRVFVTLDRIRIDPVSPGAHAYVFGQAADYIKHDTIKGAPYLGLKALPFLTDTIATPAGCSPRDLYVGYPTQMHTAEGMKPLPRAPGLSGSGMWVVNPRKEGVWTPDLAQITAVQQSWYEFEWLRGTPMREWLQLVRDDIPELAPEIVTVHQGDRRSRK